MKYKKRIVYESVCKCDICGKSYSYMPYMMGHLKLRGLKLDYTQRLDNTESIIPMSIIPMPAHRVVRNNLDICHACGRNINEFLRELKKQDGDYLQAIGAIYKSFNS